MSDDVLVQATDLKKTFGNLEVLHGVSFSVRAGETLCVWGPSGAGKSTLLHLVGLMTRPTGGTLTLFGRSVDRLTESERAQQRNKGIGFLFQFHHLLPDLSLLENVMMPLLIRRQDRSEAEKRAKILLERLGLSGRWNHRPSETSGGEQQRAALARALVGEPALILADEPTGNLDRGIGREVEALLQEEARQRRTALIIVTHDDHLAGQADRRLVLVDGRITEG